MKGNASWKGRLIQGQHKIEARKASHRTSVRVVDVIAGKDENVVVEAPTPIYGAINVTSSPTEAKVYLDGRELDETPFINNTILVGKHTLRFEKKGCATLTKEIFVEEGNVLNVNEKLDTGKLISITTGRNGDDIYVDGELVGMSPIEVSMGYGSHTIKAVRDGKKIVKSIDVNVNGGQTNVTLEFGKIVIINTDKDGDEIFIDEALVGKSPCSVYMAFGEHSIKIKRGNFIDEEKFKLTETVESHLNYNLGGMITIKTNKSGDNIYVDSQFIGYSPKTITVSAGNHKVKASRYGNYKSVEKNVNIKSGKEKEILLKIKEKKSPSNNFKSNLGINIGGGVWMNMDLLFDFNLYVEFLIHENFGLDGLPFSLQQE